MKISIHHNIGPTMMLATLVTLAIGCEATPASSTVEPAPKQQTATVAESTENLYINKAYYEGSRIEPEQIDFLNQLFHAQNTDDAQTYASLFSAEAAEADKAITFKVDQVDFVELYGYDHETTGIYAIGGAIREEAHGNYQSIRYTLKQENGEWRILGIQRPNGSQVDEAQYTGDRLEIAKLINATVTYRNAEDAQGYRNLFVEGPSTAELREDAPPLVELQIMDIGAPSAEANSAYVAYRLDGEKQVRVNTYVSVKQDQKWWMYDID